MYWIRITVDNFFLLRNYFKYSITIQKCIYVLDRNVDERAAKKKNKNQEQEKSVRFIFGLDNNETKRKKNEHLTDHWQLTVRTSSRKTFCRIFNLNTRCNDCSVLSDSLFFFSTSLILIHCFLFGPHVLITP